MYSICLSSYCFMTCFFPRISCAILASAGGVTSSTTQNKNRNSAFVLCYCSFFFPSDNESFAHHPDTFPAITARTVSSYLVKPSSFYDCGACFPVNWALCSKGIPTASSRIFSYLPPIPVKSTAPLFPFFPGLLLTDYRSYDRFISFSSSPDPCAL